MPANFTLEDLLNDSDPLGLNVGGSSGIQGIGQSAGVPQQFAPGSYDLEAIIDEVAKEYPNIPKEVVKSLSIQESGGGKNLTSPQNTKNRGTAKGPFQFIDSTAKHYIPGWTGPQDSYDPWKSARGAFSYLDDLYRQHGSIEKAVVYYHGPGSDVVQRKAGRGENGLTYAESILRRAGYPYDRDKIYGGRDVVPAIGADEKTDKSMAAIGGIDQAQTPEARQIAIRDALFGDEGLSDTEKSILGMMQRQPAEVPESEGKGPVLPDVDAAMRRYADSIKSATGVDVDPQEKVGGTTYGGMQVPENIEFESDDERGFLGNIVESFQRGDVSTVLNAMAYEAMIGKRKWSEVARLRKQLREHAANDPVEGKNWLEKGVYGASGTLPHMLRMIHQGQKSGLAGLGLGAAGAALAGQAGPQALVPEELATVPISGATGYAVGQAIGSADYGRRLAAGMMYAEMKEKGANEGVAANLANIASVPYALIEQSQIDKLVPGADKALNKIITNNLVKTLTRFAAKRAADIGAETIEEGVQGAIDETTQQVREYVEGLKGKKDIPQTTIDVLSRFVTDMQESLGTMAILSLPKTARQGVDLGRELSPQARAVVERIAGDMKKDKGPKVDAPGIGEVDMVPGADPQYTDVGQQIALEQGQQQEQIRQERSAQPNLFEGEPIGPEPAGTEKDVAKLEQQQKARQVEAERNRPNRDSRRAAVEAGMESDVPAATVVKPKYEPPAIDAERQSKSKIKTREEQIREKYGDKRPTKAQVMADFGVKSRENAARMINDTYGESEGKPAKAEHTQEEAKAPERPTRELIPPPPDADDRGKKLEKDLSGKVKYEGGLEGRRGASGKTIEPTLMFTILEEGRETTIHVPVDADAKTLQDLVDKKMADYDAKDAEKKPEGKPKRRYMIGVVGSDISIPAENPRDVDIPGWDRPAYVAPVTLGARKGERFAVYDDGTDNSIAYGDTEEEAIANAERTVKGASPEVIKKAIETGEKAAAKRRRATDEETEIARKYNISPVSAKKADDAVSEGKINSLATSILHKEAPNLRKYFTDKYGFEFPKDGGTGALQSALKEHFAEEKPEPTEPKPPAAPEQQKTASGTATIEPIGERFSGIRFPVKPSRELLDAFKDDIKRITGSVPRWNSKRKQWMFPKKYEQQVRDGMPGWFGEAKAPDVGGKLPDSGVTNIEGVKGDISFAILKTSKQDQSMGRGPVKVVMQRESPWLSVAGHGDTREEAYDNAISVLRDKIKRSDQSKPKGRNVIGENPKGQKVYEDERGVRSYANGGVVVTQNVGIIPGHGIETDAPKALFSAGKTEFLTQDEVAKFLEEKESREDSGADIKVEISEKFRPAVVEKMKPLFENRENSEENLRITFDRTANEVMADIGAGDVERYGKIAFDDKSFVDYEKEQTLKQLLREYPRKDSKPLSKRELAKRGFDKRQAKRKAGIESAEAKVDEKMTDIANKLKRLGESFEKRDPNKLYSIGTEQAELAFEIVADLVEAGYNNYRAMSLKIAGLVDAKYLAIKEFLDAIEDAYDSYSDVDDEVEKRSESIADIIAEAKNELAKSDADKSQGKPAADVPKPEGERKADGVSGKPGRVGNAGVQSGGGGRGTSSGGARTGAGGVPEISVRGTGADPRGTTGATKSPKPRNYRISDSDNIGHGGLETKYRENINAIRVLKQIEADGRFATAEEQAQLVKYTGWGALAQNVFKDPRSEKYKELEGLLEPEEFARARASTTNAHYTSPEVVAKIWDAVRRLGFSGGRVMEPAIGVGHFYGLAPADIKMSIHGIELDPTSAKIAQYLYPTADIARSGYEDVKIPAGGYDLMISNVPFANVKPVESPDAKTPGLPSGKFSLHDFYFLKSLHGVRPGGVVAFVTSHYTMDKADATVRERIASQADLLGAIRLPQTAFKGIANTDVVTDIIFLQKRDAGQEMSRSTQDFVNTASIKFVGGKSGEDVYHTVNNYFLANPEMVVGQMDASGTMYGGDQYNVVLPSGESQTQYMERLGRAIANLPEGVMHRIADDARTEMEDGLNEYLQESSIDPKSLPGGAYGYDKGSGEIFQKDEGSGKLRKITPDSIIGTTIGKDKKPKYTKLGAMGYRRLKAMTRLKSAFKQYTYLSRTGQKAEANKTLADMNRQYDAFVKKFGYLHQAGNVRAIKDDPEQFLLLSLEEWDSADKVGTKADVFTGITFAPPQVSDRADSNIDAIVISLVQYGRVDIPHMAKLRGMDEETLTQELLDEGYIFEDPFVFDSNKAAGPVYYAADEYLSGDIRAKLRAAEAAAEKDDRFNRNVMELRKVVPADLEPEQISLKINSPILAGRDVEDFMLSLGAREGDVTVRHSSVTGKWYVDGKIRGTAGVEVYGTPRVNAADIIQNMLKNHMTVVRDNVGTSAAPKMVVNQEATAEAQQREEEIRNAFANWVWADPDRRARLARDYNDKFNTYVEREYVHPGRMKNPDAEIRFPGSAFPYPARKHQADAVWRLTQNRANMLAHTVGAGKTLEIIWGAMEMKRLGLRRKSMIVVPNHMIGQWTGDIFAAYPNAKVLVPREQDLSAENRKKFLNRIATGDWDFVVVKHSHFSRIPMSKDYQVRFIQKEIDTYKEEIKKAAAEAGESSGRRKKDPTVKDLENRLKKLENKLKDLMNKPRDTGVVPYDELGVDQLFVDEADMFKNLRYMTTMKNVKGMGTPAGSDRSFDMYMKSEWLNETGSGITFATGTPISNTLVEAYNMMKFLQPGMLEKHGITSFDDWQNLFADAYPDLELNNTGSGYAIATRFRKVNNLPELMGILRQAWDIKTAENLEAQGILVPGKNMPYKKVENIAAPKTPILESYKRFLVRREKRIIEALRKREIYKGMDTILNVIADGGKAAVDMRLINNSLPDDPNSKLNVAVGKLKELYDKYSKQRYVSVVFFDRPRAYRHISKDEKELLFDAQQQMKDKLVEMGVDPKEVAFIQDYKTDLRKQQLFDAVNSGKIRILFGSTEKMGAGTNIHKRLKAIIHMDAPWRPRDIEQRNGRGFRQGNMVDDFDENGNKTNRDGERGTIEIYNMVTKGSLDTGKWDVLTTKAKAITDVMSGGDKFSRDIDEESGYFESAKEMSIDSPLLKESVQLKQDIKKLELAQRAHISQVSRAKATVELMPKEIEKAQSRIETLEKEVKARAEQPKGDSFKITIEGKEYTKPSEAGEHIVDNIFEKLYKQAQVSRNGETDEVIGKFAGYQLSARVQKGVGFASYYLDLKSPHTGVTYSSSSASGQVNSTGVIQKMSNSLYSALDKRLEELKGNIEGYRNVLEQNKPLTERAFDKERDLVEKKNRLAEVMKLLDEEGKKQSEIKPEDEPWSWEALTGRGAVSQDDPDVEIDFGDDADGDADPEHDEFEDLLARGWDMVMPAEPKTAKRVNLTQIMRYVEKTFGVAVRGKANLRFEAVGRYYPKHWLIRMKTWGELPVLVHEVAHHIDARMRKAMGNYWKTKGSGVARAIANELKRLDYEPEKGRLSEGFAEFMRFYMTTDKAQQLAPEFYKFFTSSFLAQHTEVAKQIAGLKDMVETWRDQGDLNRMDAQRDSRGEHSKESTTVGETAKGKGKKAYEQWVDSLYPLHQWVEKVEHATGGKLRPSENPYTMAVYHKQKMAAVTRTMVMDRMVDFYGNRVYKSLKEVIEPIKTDEFQIFLSYAEARRADLLHKRGVETGKDQDTVERILETYGNETWERVSDEITEWSNHLMSWLVDAGSLSEKERAVIRAKNPVYIPFKRAFIQQEGFISKGAPGLGGGTDSGTGVHRIKGSGRPTINPIQALIQQTSEVVAKAQKVHIARLIADIAKRESLEGPIGIYKANPPTRAAKFNAMQIEEQLREMGLDVEGADLDEMMTVFTTGGIPNAKDNIVSFWQDGERKYYELDPDLYAVVKTMDMPRMEGVMKYVYTIGAATRTIRAGAVTFNPAFALWRNPLRDFQTWQMNTKSGIGDPRIVGKAYREQLAGKKSELMQRFESVGGSMAGIMGYDREMTMRAEDEILASKLKGMGKTLYTLRHPGMAVNVVRDFLSIFEMIPRSAELEAMYEKYRQENPTWTDEDCFVQAFNDAQDVTVNFTRSGTIGRNLNIVTAFFNSNVQGIDKAYRTAKGNPAQYVLKGLGWLTLPALALWAVNRQEEWYKNLPEEYKYGNLFIPTPGGPLRVPIPFEPGLFFMSIPVAMADRSPRGFEAVVKQLGRSMPGVTPSMFTPWFDIWKNKNYFGRPIEHPAMQRLVVDQRTTRYTKWYAKMISKGFTSIGMPLSPVQVDYLIDQYTGGASYRVGSAVKTAGAIGASVATGSMKPLEETIHEPGDIPFVGDLFVRSREVPKRQLDTFWSEWNRLEQRKNSKVLTPQEARKYTVYKSFYKDWTGIFGPSLRTARDKNDRERMKKLYASVKRRLEMVGIK